MPGLKVLLQNLQAEVSCLEKEKTNSTAKLKDDSEFTRYAYIAVPLIDSTALLWHTYRLQRELEACRNSSEEAECRRLSKELEDLQRMSYQKQMKYHTYAQGMKKTSDGNVFQPLQLQSTHLSRNPHTIQFVKKSMPSQAHCSTSVKGLDGRMWRKGELEQREDAATNSSMEGVVDDEWLTGEDECEDWELEALAEASELTALDLDEDSDDFMEEEEEMASHGSIVRDATLLRKSLTRGDGTYQQGTQVKAVPPQGQIGHTTPGYLSSSSALTALPPTSVSVGHGTGQRPLKNSRIQQQNSSFPLPSRLPLPPPPPLLIQLATVADTSTCSNPVRKRPGQSIYKPPGQQQVTASATGYSITIIITSCFLS